MKWKFEVTLNVTNNWVEDGFNPDNNQIEEALRNNMLTYANSAEFKVNVKTLLKPYKKEITRIQGY